MVLTFLSSVRDMQKQFRSYLNAALFYIVLCSFITVYKYDITTNLRITISVSNH